MGALSQLQQIGLGFAGLGVASSAVSGFGQYESGQAQKRAYDYNAAVTLDEMRKKTQTTEAEYSNLIGKQASAYARAGVDIASGSPLLVMAHAAATGAVEQESEVQAGEEQAALLKYQGKVAAYAGTLAGVSTFVSGLTKAGLQTSSILGPNSAVPTSP